MLNGSEQQIVHSNWLVLEKGDYIPILIPRLLPATDLPGGFLPGSNLTGAGQRGDWAWLWGQCNLEWSYHRCQAGLTLMSDVITE